MSNAAVGPVYDTIISEVINAVRVDFEENGVDDSALEDLKKVRLPQSLPFVLTIAALSFLRFVVSVNQTIYFSMRCELQSLDELSLRNRHFSTSRWLRRSKGATSVGFPSGGCLCSQPERGWRAAGLGGRPGTFGSLFKVPAQLL
jgi:hypothetical protein